MTQREFIHKLVQDNQKAIIVGSLGTISYDLNDAPHPLKVLIRGAMGAALGCGLGIALAKPDRQVIVLIGDGSYLMKAGSASTILRYRPPNLRVVIIDNGCYASCGGQKTNFSAVKHLVPFEIHEISS